MIKPTIPLNEAERLKTLMDYEVLDTAAEDNFDDLTKAASEICQMPIAFITLCDSDRQWFKSTYGFEASEGPRETSFCGHTINEPDMLVVPDTLEDERFFDNPQVTDGIKVRFYAGVPVIAPSGHAIGTLCVVDTVGRELSPQQRLLLKTLAKQVVAQLELRKSLRKIRSDYVELQLLSKKVMEQKEIIQQQEKLAVIGELSSGVAHEINNPLAIINSITHIAIAMIKNKEASAVIIGQLTKINHTVDRLAKIGKALRDISEGVSSFKDAESVEQTFYSIMDEAKKVV